MDSRTIHLRPSENVSLEQPYPLVIAAVSHSPGDSDMEMEDDITQIEDRGMDHLPKGLNSRCDINNNMLNVGEHLYCQPVQISTDGNAIKDVLSEKESAAGCSRLVKEDLEGIANADQMAFRASVSKINSVKSTVPTKQPPVMSLEKSNTSGQLAKSVCSFGLTKDYASDDNSEDVEVGSSVDSDRLQKEPRLEGENMKLGSQHKLDKFGRLVRDGASDSDSDDSCYVGRYKRRRPQSRNQSHSPLDRRRRSPQRRKKRSLSRSWSPRNRRSRSRSPRNRRSRSSSPRNRRSRSRSPRNRRSRSRSPRNRSRSRSPRNRRRRSRSPRNRRSRSRSPRNRRSRSRSLSFQHTDKFSGENKRRVKGQMPFCFDFRRGKCYRGVSCRYLHHDSGKSNESRWQRSKQPYLELLHASRSNNACEVIKQSYEKRENSADGGVHYQDNQSNEHHMVKSDTSKDIPGSLFETHLLENKQETTNLVSYEKATESQHLSTIDSSSVGNISILKSCGNASQEVLTSFSSPLDPVCQSATCLPQQSDNSSMSDSLPGKPSTSPLNRLPESNVHPHTMDLHNHPCHISSPSVLCSHGKDNPHMKQQQTSSAMFQSSGESFHSYMLPSQQSYLALQPNLSFPSLPLPPPPPPPPPPPSLDSTVTPSVSSHFRLSYFHPRNDFGSQIIPRPYLTELPACSQSDGFQQRAYPPTQDANQPILQVSLPVCSLPGAPCMSRDDGLTQPPMQNVIASKSFSQGNTDPHTLPFSQQFVGNKMQPFPIESLQPGGLSYSSSYIHPYAQQQQPHSSYCPVIDGIYNLGGKMNSSSKVPPNIGDTSSHRADIGGSSSSIPNPNASTLVQPMNTKLNYDILPQEKDIAYNNNLLCLAHHPVHGRVIGYQQATLSPNSTRAFEQNCLRTGGDQYDPLFDSIEPSSSLLRKNNCIQKLEVTGDSDILLGLGGSSKPLNMGQNKQRKDAAAAASVASAGSEEFGEIADGEVGAVESGSPSNPVEANMATNEVEIDQIKSQGKNKDSRSMKHFKVALACFVKELLKPSWQQGNMSKEAFKTIVKKTIDKVSGAIKSHHIPKSRAKIDRYIESSQQKLTKLVMGYVDKYVNV